MQQLTEIVKILAVENGAAAGTTVLTSDPVDTQGFEGVAFVVKFGAITDGTPKVYARQGAESDMSDGADLEGTAQSFAGTDDNELCVIDIVHPQERYVDCKVDRSLGSPSTGAVLDSIVALLYGPKVAPVTQPTATNVERFQSPDEGTA